MAAKTCEIRVICRKNLLFQGDISHDFVLPVGQHINNETCALSSLWFVTRLVLNLDLVTQLAVLGAPQYALTIPPLAWRTFLPEQSPSAPW